MAELDELQIKIAADSSAATREIDKLTRGLERLGASLTQINGNSLFNIAQGTRQLAIALQSYKDGDFGHTFTSITTGLGKIAQVDHSAITNVAGSLTTLNNSISGLTVSNDVITSLGYLATTINKLGYAKVATANINISQLTATLTGLLRELQQFQGVDVNVTGLAELTTSISKLGGKTATKAISNIPLLETSLKKFIETLSQVPQVSQNTIDLINALSGLAASGQRVGSATRGLNSAFNILSGGMGRSLFNFKRMNIHLKGLKGSFGSLAAAVGKVYANVWLVVRAFQSLGKSVNMSMDWKEITNYFNAAISNIAKKSVSSFEESGKQSAEAYYTSFSDTLTTLTKKMSGYSIAANGALTASNVQKSLGINPSQLLNYQTLFAQMADSIGEAGEYTIKLSNAMTMLGADLSSVKNVEFTDTWNNLSSGVMAGMSRAMDKFGINVRAAAMDAKLLELGIETSTKAIGQEEKALLRAIIALDSSRYAWADLARTIDTPANSMRRLNANFKLLGQYIGNIFLPVVAGALPYVNALVVALQRVATSIVTLMGFTDFEWGTGASSFSDVLSDIYDSAEDAADGISDVEKATRDIMGFDEINKLSDATKTSLDAEQTSAYLKALQDAFDKIYDEYQAAWDSAYDKVDSNTGTLANKIFEALKKAYDTSDWSYLGNTLSNKLNEAILNIDFLELGRSIGKGINKIPTLALGTVSRISWKKVGQSLGKTINGITDEIDFSAIGLFFAESINAVSDFVLSFLNELDYDEFSDEIVDGINTMLNNIDAKKFSKALRKLTDSVVKTINKLVRKINWGKVISDIGTIIAGLDWNLIAAIGFATGVPKLVGSVTGMFTAGLQKFFVNEFAAKMSAMTIPWGTIAKGLGIGSLVVAVTAAVGIGIQQLDNYMTKLKDTCNTDIVNNWAAQGEEDISGLANAVQSFADGLTAPMRKINDEFGSISLSKTNIENTKDSLSEMFNAINEGYLSAEEYIPKFIDLVNSVFDETQQNLNSEYELIVMALAGSFGGALEAAGVEVDELAKLLGKGKDNQIAAIKELQDKMAEYKAEFDETGDFDTYWKKLSQAIRDSGYITELDNIKIATDDALTALTKDYSFESWFANGDLDLNEVKTFFEKIKTTYEGAGDEITNYYENIKTAISDLTKGQLDDDQISDALSASELLRDENLKDLEDYVTNVNGIITNDLIGGLKTAIDTASKDYDSMNWFQKLFVGSKDTFIKNRVDDFKKNNIDPISEQMKTYFDEMGVDVGETASETSDKIVNSMFSKTVYVAGGHKKVSYTLADDWETIFDDTVSSVNAGKYGEEIVDEFSNGAVRSGGGAGRTINKSILNGLEGKRLKLDLANEAETAVGGIADGINAATKNDYATYVSAGNNVLNGFMEGINDPGKQNTIFANITNFAGNVIDKIKKTLGIHSPSTVFRSIGEYTVEGFNEGIADSIASTDKIMDKWASEIANYEFDTSFMSNKGIDVNANTVTRTQSTIVGGTLDALVAKVDSLIAKDNNINVTAEVNLEGDAKGLFRKVQSEARSYSAQTGRMAFV